MRTVRERANNGPPKKKRRAKEGRVFHFMPYRRTEREIKCRRHMPREQRQRHQQPTNLRTSNRIRGSAQRGPLQEGTDSVSRECSGKPPQQRQQRRTE